MLAGEVDGFNRLLAPKLLDRKWVEIEPDNITRELSKAADSQETGLGRRTRARLGPDLPSGPRKGASRPQRQGGY